MEGITLVQVIQGGSGIAILIAGVLFDRFRRTLDNLLREQRKHTEATYSMRQDREKLNTTLDRLLEFMIRQDERQHGGGGD